MANALSEWVSTGICLEEFVKIRDILLITKIKDRIDYEIEVCNIVWLKRG